MNGTASFKACACLPPQMSLLYNTPKIGTSVVKIMSISKTERWVIGGRINHQVAVVGCFLSKDYVFC